MNAHDFILNIGEYYKYPKDPADQQRLKDVYLKEFEFYKGDKLQKVWESVRRHHKKSFAPVIGEILDCMDKVGIVESKDFKNRDKYYSRCDHCGTNFLIKSIGCPVCSWRIKESRPARTNITVVKCRELPTDLKLINPICMQCKDFKKSKIPFGAKCNAWGTFDNTLKAGKDCKNCPCYSCCNEVLCKRDLETGKIVQTILEKNKNNYGDEDQLDVNGFIPPM